MHSRFVKVGLLFLAFVMLLGVGATVFAQGEIVYAMNREPDMFDLHTGSSRYDLVVAANVFDTYLYLTEDGEYLPWLADEVTASDDARVYTIKLRSGVTFHDGTPLNAEAVKFNFDRIVDPDTASRAAIGDMGSYEQTEIVDDLTVRVHFSDPHPAFWNALADWRAGGPHSPAALQADADGFKQAPVGTGPFKFVEWVERDHITIEPYEDYNWPYPRAEHEGAARPDRVIFRIIPEDQSRVIALTTGEVNAAMRIPPQSVGELQSNSDVYLNSVVLPGTGVILVVNGSKPPTNDLAVRQALLYATDPQAISRVGYFNAWQAHLGSVLSAPNPSFVDLSGEFPLDLEKAAQLLDEAGWVDSNGDGIRDKDGNEAVLQYIGFPNPETTRVIEFLQATLRPIGMDVQILELDSGAIQKARQAGDHNIAHLTWIFKEGGFLRTLFHSENIGTGWNFTHLADSEVDGLLEAVETEADLSVRGDMLERVQRRMLEQGMVIPTVYQQQINAYRNEVQGIKLYEVYGEAPYFYDAYVEGQ
ncbi:MAG: ABC transporter substrate-binding protein [Trueperaceae bacterium]|nr:MAG: ABC transporter substrate-binding protein [Trueperaceae bacterium]